MEKYKGTIIEESLIDNRIINELDVVKVKISQEENAAERWHLYMVSITKDEINKISRNLKSEKWYAHFWKEKDVVVVFKNKIFNFNFDKKESWKPAIEYGLSLGIPQEQLDFPVD